MVIDPSKDHGHFRRNKVIGVVFGPPGLVVCKELLLPRGSGMSILPRLEQVAYPLLLGDSDHVARTCPCASRQQPRPSPRPGSDRPADPRYPGCGPLPAGTARTSTRRS